MIDPIIIGKATLYNIDCMEFMRGLPDHAFDLAIVDPPYNIVSRQKRGIGSRIDVSGKMNDWNNKKPNAEYYDQLFRVSENIANKISRGKFTAVFLLQCLEAIGCTTIHLD